VPGFDPNRFLGAIRAENVDWKQVATMLPPTPKIRIREQQQIFRSAYTPNEPQEGRTGMGREVSGAPGLRQSPVRSPIAGAVLDGEGGGASPVAGLEQAGTVPPGEAAGGPGERGAEDGGTAGTPPAAGLSWVHVKRHTHDALWYFCGEEPRYFSTTATLRASGYTDPDRLEWFITRGADKVYSLTGYTGPEITLKSTAGSVRPDDVEVRVSEGLDPTAPSYTGRLTVRKPHRLAPSTRGVIGARDRDWDGGFLSFVSYRMVDNVGGTIIGGTMNERFGTETDDTANNWPVPSHRAGYDVDLNGIVTDVIGIRGLPRFNPPPQTPGPARTPPAALGASRVDAIEQTFSIGSLTPGRGCRVQTNDFVRYRDHGRHENVVSPAP
ncbi:MAG TPA: hypothetical protein VLC95_02915, partial [Anaerolineae bacterium]|nr:hypothetical protein [Anaerolineae bacterium]